VVIVTVSAVQHTDVPGAGTWSYTVRGAVSGEASNSVSVTTNR